MIIETSRLRLRPVLEADLPAIVAGMSDWSVAQWLERTPWPYTDADAKTFMELVAANHEGPQPGVFAIALDETDAFIGSVGVEAEGQHGVIGYWFHPAVWGQGFASEAVATIIRHAFDTLALDRLRATTDPDNARSQRLLVEAGFGPAGTRPADPPTRRGHGYRPLFELRR